MTIDLEMPHNVPRIDVDRLQFRVRVVYSRELRDWVEIGLEFVSTDTETSRYVTTLIEHFFTLEEDPGDVVDDPYLGLAE